MISVFIYFYATKMIVIRSVTAGKYVIFCVLLLLCDMGCGHPQCLDLRPPFQVSSPGLQLCSKYNDVGCCDLTREAVIVKSHGILTGELSEEESRTCLDRLRDILCLPCSPYAAHVYDSEENEERSFPGLCVPYCHSLYTECHRVIPLITNDTHLLSALSAGRDAFCDYVSISDVDYCYPDLETNDLLNQEIIRTVSNRDGCLCVEPFAEDLYNPLAFAPYPDGSGRLMVGEQRGMLHVFMGNKTRVPEPFLDLRSSVLSTNRGGDERGLLGLAFHPQFSENYQLYVYYSTTVNEQHTSRISELKADPGNTNRVQSGSERTILEISQPYVIHNGGMLLFGEEGYLYIFLGDGGQGSDRRQFAQNRTLLLGKALRIDVDTVDRNQPYGIPPTNPYVLCENQASLSSCQSTWRKEIYAYGFRNVWRCGMDTGDPQTGYGRGRIFCGDVGQASWEEIDIIEPGGNYGWPKRQGLVCYRNNDCDVTLENEVKPIHVYHHDVGKSVTGGYVYRGCHNPNMMGWYIFGDYNNGKLFKLEENVTTGTWRSEELVMCGDDVCFNGLVSTYDRYLMAFGEDADGELYILTTGSSNSESKDGRMFKLIDPKLRGDPSTCRSKQKPQLNKNTKEENTTTDRNDNKDEDKKPDKHKPDRLIKPPSLSCEQLYPWLVFDPDESYDHLGCVSSLVYQDYLDASPGEWTMNYPAAGRENPADQWPYHRK